MPGSRAFWVSKSVIAWDLDAEGGSVCLYGSENATLSVEDGEIQGLHLHSPLIVMFF